MNKEGNGNTVVTFWLETLTILLIILKIMGKINISWLWVFAPIWLPLIILAVFLLFAFFIFIAFDKFK